MVSGEEVLADVDGWAKRLVAQAKAAGAADAAEVAKGRVETLLLKHYPGGRDHDQRLHGKHGLGPAGPHAYAEWTEAKEHEPYITGALHTIAAESGGKLVGLTFKLKGRASLERKISGDAADNGGDLQRARDGIRDSLRYTVESQPGDYIQTYRAFQRGMFARGFLQTKEKNYWREGDGSYRGLNTNWKTKDGFEFEVQFHTKQSRAVKETAHKLYEVARHPSTPSREAERAIRQMQQLWASIEMPSGWGGI